MKTSSFTAPLAFGLAALALGACATSSSSTAAAPAPAPAPASSMAAAPMPAPPLSPAPVKLDASAPQPVAGAVLAAVDFDVTVKPFFATYCIRCHGPTRQSSRVRFDTKAGILARLTVGNASRSAFYQAVNNGNMPPEGQPRPSAEELVQIKQWITDGAKIPDTYPAGG